MDTHRDSAREWLVTTALAYLGTPYVWGGDDPSGFDCSGLVVECLKSVGLLDSVDLSADGLLVKFRDYAVAQPARGCLVFLLDRAGKARHVGICLDRWHFIEAGGGDNSVADQSAAWKRNAFVRIRPLPNPGSRRIVCDPISALKE
ncbi:MAG: NlpC/P60 family protein [Candidatus Zixiibacteriota bacterium]